MLVGFIILIVLPAMALSLDIPLVRLGLPAVLNWERLFNPKALVGVKDRIGTVF